MGYYVTLTDSDFTIPETPEVLAAIHDMDVRFDAIKRGGTFGPDGMTEKWFSWMPQLSTLTSVEQVFTALGFEVYIDIQPEGEYVRLTGYDNKTGQEDLFLAVVAPFVKDGSYTEWRGEDGALYRYEARNGRLTKREARIEWTDPQPYGYAHFGSTGSFGEGSYRSFSIVVDPYTDDETIIDNLIEDAARTPA